MELYHALNRGVDGRTVFLDSADYARFTHNMYEFNDLSPAPEFNRRQHVGNPISHIREKIVDIHGWCLMKNHYHLAISARSEHGLSLFLKKLNIGYTHYFNQKHGRTGVLFQGKTKRVLVEREPYFLYLLHYIHLNPLDYLVGAEDWRERSQSSIRSAHDALAYLSTYRWSSYLDYAGKKNFPSLLTKELFEGELGSYTKELRDYLRAAEMATGPADLRLE